MSDWPADLLYTPEHEWVRVTDNMARVGVTSHAADALGDIVYVSLPTVGANVSAGDACAELESTKSVNDVYAPVGGVIAAVNEALADAPEAVGEDPFGTGWLFDVEFDGSTDGLMDAEAYAQLVGGLESDGSK